MLHIPLSVLASLGVLRVENTGTPAEVDEIWARSDVAGGFHFVLCDMNSVE